MVWIDAQAITLQPPKSEMLWTMSCAQPQIAKLSETKMMETIISIQPIRQETLREKNASNHPFHVAKRRNEMPISNALKIMSVWTHKLPQTRSTKQPLFPFWAQNLMNFLGFCKILDPAPGEVLFFLSNPWPKKVAECSTHLSMFFCIMWITRICNFATKRMMKDFKFQMSSQTCYLLGRVGTVDKRNQSPPHEMSWHVLWQLHLGSGVSSQSYPHFLFHIPVYET